jgi:glucose-6-phosphate isomerase
MANEVKVASDAVAWKALERHYNDAAKTWNLRSLFAADPARFSAFSRQFTARYQPEGKAASSSDEISLFVDFSKNIINNDTFRLFGQLLEERKLSTWINKMFSGEAINNTEKRAVLHVALRNRSNRPILVDGKDVMPDVNRVLAQMKAFSDSVRSVCSDTLSLLLSFIINNSNCVTQY